MHSEPEHVDESLPRDEWEQREVYARFGVAIYFCQTLETNLVSYLAVLRRAKRGPMTDSEVDDLFARLFRNPFGLNLKEVHDLLGKDWAMAEQLAGALDLRNDLVHHWMRDRVLKQGTSEQRLGMIAELEAARVRLDEVNTTLEERTRRILKRASGEQPTDD